MFTIERGISFASYKFSQIPHFTTRNTFPLKDKDIYLVNNSFILKLEFLLYYKSCTWEYPKWNFLV